MTAVNLHSLGRMTVSSSGTGTITLNTAVSGLLTFDLAGCSTAAAGTVIRYAISDTTQSEIAYGTYTSSSLTLTRGSSTTGMKSTNSDSPINMTNTAQVLIAPAELDFPIAVDSGGAAGALPLNMTYSGTATFSAAITYGGVTLNNAVTGTGNMVLSASPTFTGTLNASAIAATANSNVTLSQNATTSFTVSNVNAGAAAVSSFVATTDAGTLTARGMSTAGGALGHLYWTGAGGVYIDALNGAGSIFLRTGAGPTTAITVSAAQEVSLASTLLVTGGTTLSAPLTYGGVALNNAVTGTGNMVLSASPTFTGTITAAAATLSGVLTYGGVALNAAVTGTGNMVLSASPTFTGTITAATINASGILTVTNATASTNSSTGAIVAAGGVGVGGALNVAGNTATAAVLTGAITVDNPAVTIIGMYTSGVRNWDMWALDNGAFVIYNRGNTSGVQLASQAATSWAAYSSIRIKDQIEEMSVLDTIENFRGIRYRNKLTDRMEIGIVAEEFTPLYPELVTSGVVTTDDSPITEATDPRLSHLAYDRVGAISLQGVKELKALVLALQARIEALEAIVGNTATTH